LTDVLEQLENAGDGCTARLDPPRAVDITG
jgi:hypothetical protein